MLIAHRLGSNMTDVFPLWDKLLRLLAFHQQKFLMLLTDEMCLAIIQPSTLDISIDSYREALKIWLHHILVDHFWNTARSRSLLMADTILLTCVTSPSYWILHLAIAIVDDPQYTKARVKYGEKIFEITKQLNISYHGSDEQTITTLATVSAHDILEDERKNLQVPKSFDIV